ncbi:MAG: CDP-glycerol glycerophosphotransferase family protein, partial [Lachnospiraceae bacterium]|nr:CDP-glycerol glycerophosphotransferase family protein [Lachnospiraceae bacterium]
DWRGFYYNYSELAPGPVCKTMDELTDAIRQSGTAFDREKLAAFRKKFMSACDGHSTERIEQLVFGRSLRCKAGES